MTQYDACEHDRTYRYDNASCVYTETICENRCQIDDLTRQLREVTADRDRLLQNPAIRDPEVDRINREVDANVELQREVREGDPRVQYRCPSYAAELQANHICVYDPTTQVELKNGDRLRFVNGKAVDANGHPRTIPYRTSCLKNEQVVQENPLRCGYEAYLFRVSCPPGAELKPNGTCVYDPTTVQETSCRAPHQTVQQNPLRCAYEAPV